MLDAWRLPQIGNQVSLAQTEAQLAGILTLIPSLAVFSVALTGAPDKIYYHRNYMIFLRLLLSTFLFLGLPSAEALPACPLDDWIITRA